MSLISTTGSASARGPEPWSDMILFPLAGEEGPETGGQFLRLLLGDPVAGTGDRPAVGMLRDEFQRRDHVVPASVRSAAAESERRHRQLETGVEHRTVVRHVLSDRAIVFA